jgi:hypothetical protein
VRKLLALIGILTIVGGLRYITSPPEHVPPYDSMLNRLAETEREGFCSGWAYWEAASPAEGSAMAKECREGIRPRVRIDALSTELDPRLKEQVPPEYRVFSDVPDMEVVPEAFCDGLIAAGWSENTGVSVLALQAGCMELLDNYRLWPTHEPGLSNAWDEKWPFPGEEETDSNRLRGEADDGP